MKRSFLLTAIGLIAAPALASPGILPVAGVAGTWRYDLQTGEQTPVTGLERDLGPAIWASNQMSGQFWWSQGCTEWVLDWGDIETPAGVGGFGFAYATNANHGTIDLILTFYRDDNGWNTPGRDPIIAWTLTGLNGTRTPQDRDQCWSWIYRGEVPTLWVMAANDLDGDLLGDWSYTYWFDCATLEGPPSAPNPIVGPLIAGDPNAGTAPGIEDWYDLFDQGGYVGTYSFGGDPFAQFYMELFAPGCPSSGHSGRYCEADIDGSFDCLVNLADLAQLLANYGRTTGCTRMMGDVDPYDRWFPGDGDVDVADLAELLAQYGDDCN